MSNALSVTFRHMEASRALEDVVAQKLEKLQHLHAGVTSCHVIVEQPHSSQRKGAEFHVQVRVDDTHAGTHAQANASDADAYIAVRDVFEAIRHQLDRHRTTGHDVRHATNRILGD